jgi:phenylpropionate dioxygenase-like ring-hydroxylating dioxygenase large terminal subunit
VLSGGLPEAVIEFSPHVHRQWFAVALSKAITQRPVRVFLLGWPFVLARLESGVVAALEDRCPHRGVPLSEGQVIPLGLSCRYHGWTFDQAGRCTLMPGTEDAQSVGDIRVTSLFVVERDGVIWVGRSTSVPLPERVMAMKTEHLRFVWQTKWVTPAIDAQERFFDALYAHTKKARLADRFELNVEGDGFRIEPAAQPEQSGILSRLFEWRCIRQRAYLSSLSSAQLEYRYASGRAIWMTVCFTPETLVSTLVVGTLHVQGRWLSSWLQKALIQRLLRSVADQEQRPVESQNRPPVITRDLIRPYLEEAWFGTSWKLPARSHGTIGLTAPAAT